MTLVEWAEHLGVSYVTLKSRVALGMSVERILTPGKLQSKQKPATGEKNHKARLTENAVLDIRRRHAAGERIVDLAKERGVSREAVAGIVHRRTWKHV